MTAVDEAIQWMMEIGPKGLPQDQLREFEAWLALHPDNQQAWNTLQRGLTACNAAARQPAARMALDMRLQRLTTRRTVVRRAVAGAGVVLVGLAVGEQFFPLEQVFASSATRTGERRRLDRADGSSVILGPRSALDIGGAGNPRFVRLRAGRIVADVAPNNEPFIVDMPGMTMRVLGGRVLVTRSADLVSATVIEGEGVLEVAGGARSELRPGSRAMRDGEASRIENADIEVDTAWTDGLLIAKNQTLAWIVDELRLYFPGTIRCRSDVARMRATGVFRLDNPRGALDAIASSHNLEVANFGGYLLMLRRKEV